MELIQKLINRQGLTDEENFNLISHVLQLINSAESDEVVVGRNNLILVIENWEIINGQYRKAWIDVIEAVGFYPYLGKLNLEVDDLDAKIRQHYHQSDILNNKYFHAKQKELSNLVLSKKNVIVSAPTSFGKSLLIEEIIASKIYHNTVIIQPTLALLDETRLKLKRYANEYRIIVRTSQRPSEEKGNVFLLTAERVLEYVDMPKIDLLILDEFYKLSNKRDDRRAGILNNAFIKLMKENKCKFYMLGPNIDNISQGFAEKYNAEFFKTNYSLVFTESDDRFENVTRNRRGTVNETDLFKVLDELTGQQTLIFCSSPNKARNLAFNYYQHLKENDKLSNINLPVIDWIKENVSENWSLRKCLAAKIAVHDGALQKHLTTSIIQYFNSRKINYLFCTTTIIEGVNTSAKNVVYYDDYIADHPVDYFDYSNIKGRAGRLMEHFTGRIINLQQPPPKETTVIDIPFYDQDPIEVEVLVNLDENDVKDIRDNKQRYADFKKLDLELQEILKKNGVSIEKQLEILNILHTDLQDYKKRSFILWNSYPQKMREKFMYLFGLCWERLATKEEHSSALSIGWLSSKTVGYCLEHSLMLLIKEEIFYRVGVKIQANTPLQEQVTKFAETQPLEYQIILDSAIERIFKLHRNWFQYKIPKWLGVLDSLQKYVCKKLGLDAGDYTFIADQIENEFISDNLRILLEYGIPSSAIQKLNMPSDYKEDQVILSLLRKLNDLEAIGILTEYEIETIRRSLS